MILSQEEEDDMVKVNKKSKESVEEEEYEYGLPISVNRYLAVASNHRHVKLKRRRILEKVVFCLSFTACNFFFTGIYFKLIIWLCHVYMHALLLDR